MDSKYRYFMAPNGLVYQIPKSGARGLDLTKASILGKPEVEVVAPVIYLLDELDEDQIESVRLLYG